MKYVKINSISYQKDIANLQEVRDTVEKDVEKIIKKLERMFDIDIPNLNKERMIDSILEQANFKSKG